MAPDYFHSQPFDEGTLTKLQILELYAREWLPVFFAREVSPWREVHIYDFFCGPGTDSDGVPGSPLRLLNQLDRVRNLPGYRATRKYCHFSDSDGAKIARLRRKIEEQELRPNVMVHTERYDFPEALNRSRAILDDPHAAKLLFIDQYGVDS